MARNFRIYTQEINQQSLALQLFGDFDATSACELIDILTDIAKENDNVAIDTNGLKTVNEFGLNVFIPCMSRLSRKWTGIQVTGRYKDLFMEA